jgi:uncharacterized protein (DUF2249 family)
MMSLTLRIRDLRGMSADKAKMEIRQMTSLLEKNSSFWLIADHEPVEYYEHLKSNDLHFQTFICGDREYRLFVSRV